MLNHFGGECARAVSFIESRQVLPLPTRNDDAQWLAGKLGLRLSLPMRLDYLQHVQSLNGALNSPG